MQHFNDLIESIKTYLEQIKAHGVDADSLASLKRTFKSNNITIQDWNQLVDTIENSTVVPLENIEQVLEDIKSCLSELDDEKLNKSKEAIAEIGGLVTPDILDTEELVGIDAQGRQMHIQISDNLNLAATETDFYTLNADNQKIKVGSAEFGSNATINLIAGNNISLTANTSSNTITIAATGSAASVTSVNSKTGDVVLNATDINLTASTDVTVQEELTSINEAIGDLEDEKADLSLLDKSVCEKQTSNVLSYSGDTVTINKKYINLSDGTEETATEAISLANSSTAGLMSPSSVTAIQNLTSEVAALKAQTIRLLYTTKSNPTAAEILAFVQSKGYTDEDKYGGMAIVVQATNHIWKWLTDDEVFNDFGLDTVNQFTNTQAGIIKGSETDGKVYAEDDGTGSVVGWASLKSRVDAVEANKQGKLTTTQLAAANSGITSTKVSTYDSYALLIATKASTTDVNNKDYLKTQTSGGASSISLKFWSGTQAQYDAITTKDNSTLYFIKE